MLATLPKLADRAFVLGFLLPSLIFIVALLALAGPPGAIDGLLRPAKEDAASVLVLAAAAWLLAVFMMLLNYWLYRCLEGYLPPFRWLHRRKRRHRLAIIRANRAAAQLLRRWQAEGDSFPAAAKARYRALMLERAALPARAADAMPTAFGNAVKAFEVYPREVYGADGVSLWLRLAAITPKPLLDAAADVRSQVDCMVNASFFAAITALCVIARGLAALCAAPFPPLSQDGAVALLHRFPWHDGVLALGAAILATAFYRLAVALVPAWGDMVKACFDVGLPDLAAKAGYVLPKSEADRRRFWGAFSQVLIYRTAGDGTPILLPEDWVPPKDPAPKTIVRPMRVRIQMPRG